ncbi:MAG: tetratricopeptide repeat protein [Candidatus Brocadiia bacterium]|nr:tetratricopeptide repeat protein [Candidatus Brocadiia bacterium]
MFSIGKADRAHRRALRLAQRFRFEEALPSFQQAVEGLGDDGRLRTNYGLALAESGQPEAAVEALEKAMVLEPESAVHPMNLGLVHLDEGRVEGARGSLRRSLEIDPENPLTRGYLLLCDWDEGRRSEAMATLADQDFPLSSGFEARLLLRVEGHLSGAANAGESPGSAPPAAVGRRALKKATRLVEKAVALAGKGNLERALVTLEGAAEIAPEAPDVLEGVAKLCALAEEVLATRPEGKARLDLLHALGCLCFETGDIAFARDCMAEWAAAHRTPEGHRPPKEELQMALFVLGSEAAAAGNCGDAVKHLEELRALSPREPGVEYALGSCLLRLGRRREARQAFERLLDKAPLFARHKLRKLDDARHESP